LLSFDPKKPWSALSAQPTTIIRKLNDLLERSPSRPMSLGMRAPPVIDLAMKAEAFFRASGPSRRFLGRRWPGT
jgi:hypothetical protein